MSDFNPVGLLLVIALGCCVAALLDIPRARLTRALRWLALFVFWAAAGFAAVALLASCSRSHIVTVPGVVCPDSTRFLYVEHIQKHERDYPRAVCDKGTP